MSEQEGAGEILKAVSTEQLLQEINRRLADSQDPKERALINVIKGYSGVEQISQSKTELSNPEDEFVQAVKAVAINGKFPQGLRFQNKELVSPQDKWRDDFEYFSPTGFKPDNWRIAANNKFITSCISGIQDAGRSYPQAKDLVKKHFLAVASYELNPGDGLLIYSVHQDAGLTDSVGRHVRFAKVYFLMPIDKAQQFVQLVEGKANGADIVEQFVQKAAPGVMADKFDEPGIYRVRSSELVILDWPFQKTVLAASGINSWSDEQNGSVIGRKFLQNADKAVIKQYSQPVGFGTPPSI